MKIIDLLNKIANGEGVPNKIKTCDNDIFYYDETDDNEVTRYKNKNDVSIIDEFYLNDEVETIEEDKKIEKINDILRVYDLMPPVDENMYKIWKQTIKNHNKINELIDKVNSLEKK